MKRTLSLVLVLALVLALALPGIAVAKRGGVPAGSNGNGKGGAAAASGTDDGQGAEAPGKGDRDSRGNGNGKGNGDAAAPGKGDTVQSRDRVRSRETSGTPSGAGKRTGVENALSRLQSNLERMQADLDAGTRTSLPSGLQSAIAKFMSWLGIEGDADPVAPDGDGSEETSGTVEPGDPDVELPEDEGEPADGV